MNKREEILAEHANDILGMVRGLGLKLEALDNDITVCRAGMMTVINRIFVELAINLFPEMSNEKVLKTFSEGCRLHPDWKKKKALEK